MSKLFFPKGTLIEVVGNVASGKTTLAKLLPTLTNLSYQDTDLFEENPFMLPSVKNPKRWVFTEELYFIYLRAKKIPEVNKLLKRKALVLDQGFHMPLYMYTDNRLRQKQMTYDEWRFIHELFNILYSNAPKPQIVIYLEGPIKELERRMNKRGRDGYRAHEKMYTNSYLRRLDIGLKEYIESAKLKKSGCKTLITYNFEKQTFETWGKPQNDLIGILRHLL